MIIDRGFFVDNYVGHYHMQDHKGEKYIVSEEQRFSQDDKHKLQKKRIFEFDNRDYEYIYMELANVDIMSDKAILDYCNKYGLPHSSQLAVEKILCLDANISPDVEKKLYQLLHQPFPMNDHMSLEGFRRDAITIRKLMELKLLSEEPFFTDETYGQFLSLLIFFLFYSHQYHYSYSLDEELPRGRISRIQYWFHWIQKQCPFFFRGLLEDEQLQRFLEFLQVNMGQFLEKNVGREVPAFVADMLSDTMQDILRLASEFLYWNFSINSPNTPLQYDYDSFGEVKFTVAPIWNKGSEEKKFLNKLAKEVICGVINNGLEFSAPLLWYNGGDFNGEWKLSYQMSGIYLELYFEVAQNYIFRKCANPTCEKFFSVTRSRTNKKYCSDRCGKIEANRNKRKRDKESRQAKDEE